MFPFNPRRFRYKDKAFTACTTGNWEINGESRSSRDTDNKDARGSAWANWSRTTAKSSTLDLRVITNSLYIYSLPCQAFLHNTIDIVIFTNMDMSYHSPLSTINFSNMAMLLWFGLLPFVLKHPKFFHSFPLLSSGGSGAITEMHGNKSKSHCMKLGPASTIQWIRELDQII